MPRVLFIGKYPPIQGGTSTSAYYTVRRLIRSGYGVSVVTDAIGSTVEDKCTLIGNDHRFLLLQDESEAPSVRFTDVWRSTPKRMYDGLASFSMLLNLALEENTRGGFDLILSNYLEPYSLVAAHVAMLLKKPHVISHAGSDLFLFASDARFSLAHASSLRSATWVISQEDCRERLAEVGVPVERIRTDVAMSSAWEHFDRESRALDLQEVLDGIQGTGISDMPNWSLDNLKAFDELREERIVLGMYGKTDLRKGGVKGHREVLEAMHALTGSDLQPVLIALAERRSIGLFAREVESLGLTNKVILLPFLPPWRINEFLKTCDLATCLENDFWLQQHGPRLPLEIMASGCCGLFSPGISRRLLKSGCVVPNVHYVEVAEPLDGGIVEVLGRLTRERAQEIGHNGSLAAQTIKAALERVDGPCDIATLIWETVREERR